MADQRTVQEIIDNCYARMKRAQQGIDADEDLELRPQLLDIMRTFFTIGARLNPEFFSVQESVPWDAGISGWIRPAAAELIFFVEDVGNAEVARVPREDQTAELSMPTVYRFGQSYFPTSGTNQGPNPTEPLLFLYAKIPDAIANLGSDIDSFWPVGHESLLSLELAIYLSLKDDRKDDVEALVSERDRQLMRFLTHLEHEDIGERRRKSTTRKFQRSSFVPISQMLGGGSTVELPQ